MTDTSFFLSRIQTQIDADNARKAEHGWSLTERRPGGHTIGDLMGAIFAIDNPEDALCFYESYIAWMETLPAEDRSEQYTTAQVARSNIGWCFGEGMDSDRIAMWNTVTGAAHPVFGTMTPTPQEAFAAGLELGEQQRR